MANQVIENVVAVNEEFRKTAAAATEQVRETVSAAQERFQQNLAQAQQVQGDLARTGIRVNERNAELASAALAGFWDASLATVNAAAWGQEQIARGARQLLDQAHVTREEGTTLLRDASEQARCNQAELYRIAQETVRTGLEGIPTAGPAKPVE